jgi:hypothetical protein
VIVSRSLASQDFAPKPASRTRPRGIFDTAAMSVQNTQEGTHFVAAGWDGHVFLEGGQTLFKACTTLPRVEGIRAKQCGQQVLCG